MLAPKKPLTLQQKADMVKAILTSAGQRVGIGYRPLQNPLAKPPVMSGPVPPALPAHQQTPISAALAAPREPEQAPVDTRLPFNWLDGPFVPPQMAPRMPTVRQNPAWSPGPLNEANPFGNLPNFAAPPPPPPAPAATQQPSVRQAPARLQAPQTQGSVVSDIMAQREQRAAEEAAKAAPVPASAASQVQRRTATDGANPNLQMGNVLRSVGQQMFGTPPDDNLTPPGTPAPSEIKKQAGALQAFSRALATPGFQKMLGQLGMALSARDPNSFGYQLGAQVVADAEAQMRGEALNAVAPEGTPNLSGLDAQSQQAVLAQANENRTAGQQDRRLQIMDEDTRSQIAARAAQTYNAEQQNLIDWATLAFRKDQEMFQQDESLWRRTLDEAKLKLEERQMNMMAPYYAALTKYNQALASSKGGNGIGLGGVDLTELSEMASRAGRDLEGLSDPLGPRMTSQRVVNMLMNTPNRTPEQDAQLQAAQAQLDMYNKSYNNLSNIQQQMTSIMSAAMNPYANLSDEELLKLLSNQQTTKK